MEFQRQYSCQKINSQHHLRLVAQLPNFIVVAPHQRFHQSQPEWHHLLQRPANEQLTCRNTWDQSQLLLPDVLSFVLQ